MRAYFRPIIYLTVGPRRRTAPCPNFARMCVYNIIVSPQKKNLTHPTPGAPQGGLGGYLFSVRIFVRPYFRPIIYLTVGPRRRTAPCPNFARMCGYIVSPQKKIDPPHPGEGLGGYILLKIFRDGSRPNLAHMCG